MISKADNADMFFYADVLKLFKRVEMEDDAIALQNNIAKLYDWTKYSLLNFHPNKCVPMRIKQRSKALPFECFYNKDETWLKMVHSEKDLAVIFDNKLHFEEHIAQIVTKSTSLTGMIRRSFIHMDKFMFKTLITSIVRPHLEYGAPVWNPHHKRLINKLENVQRRATKLIPGFANISYKDRLKSLQLPTLAYRRYRGDMIELYKMTHNLYDTNATNGFLRFRTSRARGHNFNLAKETCKNDIKRYSFRHHTTANGTIYLGKL